MVTMALSGMISSVVKGAKVFLGRDCCTVATGTPVLLQWEVCAGLSWDNLLRTLDARLRRLHFPGSQ